MPKHVEVDKNDGCKTLVYLWVYAQEHVNFDNPKVKRTSSQGTNELETAMKLAALKCSEERSRAVLHTLNLIDKKLNAI